ncbi:hypothetical protein C3Y98_00845 [Methylotenera oryzisoli]|jgi:hypothetical protein|uniref:Uncharacterized protein n=1 Tax=Methylotenera oryzisoli TaxID=2080758 RepID=A0A4Y9VVU2_9PROT|nr:hypothetical protein C3Y98_00845 [Methylotenera oryzisoli]
MADLSQNGWYLYSIIGGAFKLQELAYPRNFEWHLWARILILLMSLKVNYVSNGHLAIFTIGSI